MARPQKNNADYFSHDVGMSSHRKIIALRQKFGLEGYAIWCMLLEHIAGSDYFTAKRDDTEKEILAGVFDTETHRLEQIVDFLVKINLIQLDDNLSLRCKSLEDRLAPMLEKRLRSRGEPSEEANQSVTETHSNPQKVTENTQSKVKESKVKYIEKEIYKEKAKEIINEYVDIGYDKQQLEMEANDCRRHWDGKMQRITALSNWIKKGINMGNIKKKTSVTYLNQ